MKRKGVLILFFICCVIQNICYAENSPAIEVEYLGGGSYTVMAEELEDGKEYLVFAAVYDTDNRLTNGHVRNIKAVDKKISAEFDFEAYMKNGEEVRLFLWSQDIKPLSTTVMVDKDFGVTEIAEGKPVYGTGLGGEWSENVKLVTPSGITDNDPKTSGGFYANVGTTGHMYIDLGTEYKIDRIDVLAYNNLYSDRTGNFEIVLSNSVTEGKKCSDSEKFDVAYVPVNTSTSAENAKYSSFYVDSENTYRYVSMEKFESNVFGLLIAEVRVFVRDDDMSLVEIAQHKPTGGKSLDNVTHNTLSKNIVDGDRNTRGGFYLGQGEHGYMYIDLCREYEIERIEVLAFDDILKERAGNFDIILSNSIPDDRAYDGSGGEVRLARTAYPQAEQTAEQAEYQSFNVPETWGKYRYVSFERFEESSYGMLIAEVKVYVKESEMLYNFEEYMQPLWEGDTVYNESIMFLPDPVSAEISPVPLLFEPTEIISVKSCDLKTVYEEGRDYTVENGKICFVPDGRMRAISYDDLYMKDTGLHSIGWLYPEGRYVPYRTGGYYSRMQYYVTYKHNGIWSGVKPQFAGENLPKTIEKLEKGERLRILVYGDSISAGGEVSSYGDIVLDNVNGDARSFEPYMQIYPLLLKQNLKRSYPNAEIEYMNTSVPGWSSRSAASVADTRVGVKKADLVIIAYGMNDLSFTAEEHKANIKKIMESALSTNPDSEFILVSTTLPNTESTWSINHLEEFGGVYEEIQQEIPNVAIAPMTEVHKYILTRKRFFDMTSNGINHPNDFLARVYAQVLSKLLIENY